jgi:nicotinamide-nucleotide amidase
MFGRLFVAALLVANDSNPQIGAEAHHVVQALGESRLHLFLAESLTGGALSSAIVSVPGASKVLLGCVVAYDSLVKLNLLGVSQSSLDEFGAASAPVAREMASGARKLATESLQGDSDSIVALSTTGVAGPEIQDGIAVGTVYIAIDGPHGRHEVLEFMFDGDRQSIREQTVQAALKALANLVAT